MFKPRRRLVSLVSIPPTLLPSEEQMQKSTSWDTRVSWQWRSNLLYEDILARKKISVDSSSSQLYPVLSHCQSGYVQFFFLHFFSARIQTWCWHVFFPFVWEASRRDVRKTRDRRFPPCCSPNSKFFNGDRCKSGKNLRIFGNSSPAIGAATAIKQLLQPKIGPG